MSDLNVVALTGRLVKDAELKKTADGKSYVVFSIANNLVRKNEKGEYVDIPNFFQIKMWNDTAEKMLKGLTKGRAVTVQGTLRQNQWVKDGKVHSRINLQPYRVNFVTGTSANNGSQADTKNDEFYTAEQDDFISEDIFDEDVPDAADN